MTHILCWLGLHRWEQRDDRIIKKGPWVYTHYSVRCRRPSCIHRIWITGYLDRSPRW